MRVEDLRRKEVVNLYNGIYMGRVADLELEVDNAQVLELVIHGRLRFFGLLGREDDILIKWDEIEVIGEDSILVRYKTPHHRIRKKPGRLAGLLGL